jgi:hypothetical protein
MKELLACTIFTVAMGIMASCGEDPGMYKNETINFTTPVNAKMGQKTIEEEVDLSDGSSSNFRVRHYGILAPWAPAPLFDWYLEPIPVEVPVSPFYSLIDFVHPFYAQLVLGDDDW